MINHIVMWRVNKGVDNPEGLKIAKKIKHDFEALTDQLDCIEKMKMQINPAGAPKGNHDIVLVSEFKNFELMQKYLDSEEHQLIAEFLKENTFDRSAIDYIS